MSNANKRWVINRNLDSKNSEYKWQVREESSQEIVLCRSVQATEVKFLDVGSVKGEYGACSNVAVTSVKPVLTGVKTDTVPLKYEWGHFSRRDTGISVSAAKELILGEDGSMNAVL